MRCLAKDRNNNECRNHAIGDTRFCTYHDYMVDYTEEMMNKCVCCSGCNKMMYIYKNGKTCDKCRERAKSNRNECRENVVMCKSDGCKSKKSSENAYCHKHQICLLVEEVATRNKRLCVNYIRGCRSELELDHIKNRCEICLEKDRKKDKQRRNKVKEMNEPVSELISQTPLAENIHLELGCDQTHNDEKSEVTEKTCTVCCKTATVEMFQGVKGVITKTCKTCRDMNKKNDMKRDKEHRNTLARIASKNPERITVKQVWKEENYEKVAETWQKSRNKRLVTVGEEEYLKRNADDAQRWRDNNPEKVAENNENKKKNLNLQYNIYTRSASDKNLTFKLSFDEYKELVQTHCYYCGMIQERGFNGIDRMNQTNGYIKDNCVSCCKMCNYIKKSLNIDVFLRRVEHILTYNDRILDGEYFPHLFKEHTTPCYKTYQYSATKKQLEFSISSADYDNITSKVCYICGKFPSTDHKTGIDRFNSNIGYVLVNCRPCCGECNYMKNNYDYDIFMNKLEDIYEHRVKKWKEEFNKYLDICFPDTENTILETDNSETHLGVKEFSFGTTQNIFPISSSNAIMVTSNKKSKEEITECARIRKQEQRKRMKEKFGNEEYRKIHAQEIAKNRKKKHES